MGGRKRAKLPKQPAYDACVALNGRCTCLANSVNPCKAWVLPYHFANLERMKLLDRELQRMETNRIYGTFIT